MMFSMKQQFGIAFIKLDIDMEDAAQSVCAENNENNEIKNNNNLMESMVVLRC